MELNSNFVISDINKYFNNILKAYLKFPETYSISFYPNINRITLQSNSESKLIELINKDKKIKASIEQALLSGFKNKNDNILNVNLYNFKPNEIVITYTYGEVPLKLAEIGILAKLVAEHETININEICTINPTFAKACKDELFWWEIIKNKYPKYYKEKRSYIHNPKEILRGLDAYEKMINSKRESHRLTVRGVYKKQFPKDIKHLFIKFLSTVRYLILENVWILSEDDIIKIFSINISISKEILKYIISNYKFKRGIILKLFVDLKKRQESELLFQNDMEILRLIIKNYDLHEDHILYLRELLLFGGSFDERVIDETERLLKLQGKKLFSKTSLENMLDSLIGPAGDVIVIDNVDVYKWLIKKLGLENNIRNYLKDLSALNPKNLKIAEYILSQLSTDVEVDIDQIYNILKILIDTRDSTKMFEIIYIKFSHLLTKEDKDDLIETAESVINSLIAEGINDNIDIKDTSEIIEFLENN